MLDNSSASAACAMRPGLLSGSYPERSDADPGVIDQAFKQLQGAAARLNVNRQTGLKRIAADIGKQGEILAEHDSADISGMVKKLRQQFHLQGLTKKNCLQAFALIRELADRTLGLKPFDSQLMGAWAILHGKLAEMETGEGKTLAATLAAATAGLAGIPVHVITVNEYLVERDAKLMGPLYQALGLTVGTVTSTLDESERRAGYSCDITYCTNKQVAFDYLRDRLVLGNNCGPLRLQLAAAGAKDSKLGRVLLRGLCFAIVDEADSVLIDEARTPLILTRSLDSSEAETAYRQALQMAAKLEMNHDYYCDFQTRNVQLSLAGQQNLKQLLTETDSSDFGARRWEELILQALFADLFLQRDRDYLIQEDKVVIIDANTGRTMADRSWERGLHQMVEIIENCPVSGDCEQLARLTYQRFFRRYLRLGGMTGTASEVSSELWSVYGLRVKRVPLNRPCQRELVAVRVYPQSSVKRAAVIDAVKDMQKMGRPVLIGTGSVEESESLSAALATYGIDHRILNARQDQEEADIVAQAGCLRQVTVATNMAGRGTDIPLGKRVADLGGLHVISTCRNAAKRIDRQLAGRCGRQGDPGSYEAILSLDDELIEQNSKAFLIRLSLRFAGGRSSWSQYISRMIFNRAQRAMEQRHWLTRKQLLQHDRQIGRTLAFTGNIE